MSKIIELKIPRLQKQREEYAKLVEQHQQLMLTLRTSIELMAKKLQEDILNIQNQVDDEKQQETLISAINAVTRVAQVVVKIIPLELELACIETLDEDKMVAITTREEIEMVERCIRQWQEKRSEMDALL